MKDTLANILETPRVRGLARQRAVAGGDERHLRDVPARRLRVGLAGVAAEPATVVGPPRVAGALAHLECRLTQAIPLGGGAPGKPSATLVVAEVVHFAVASDLLVRDARGRLLPIDPARLAAVGRLGGIAYTRTTDRVSLLRAGAAETPGTP
jgi:flavin reductase (DIM6/NTAB) family NADH-FMN oxidoreductase RutF